jgi:hypothetical protein
MSLPGPFQLNKFLFRYKLVRRSLFSCAKIHKKKLSTNKRKEGSNVNYPPCLGKYPDPPTIGILDAKADQQIENIDVTFFLSS